MDTELYAESSLVWARYDDVWYPAMRISNDSLEDQQIPEGYLAVYCLPDDGIMVLPPSDLLRFSLDDEEKMSHPAVQAGIQRARELMAEAGVVMSAAPAGEDEEKARRKAEKKLKKEAKKAEKARRKAEKKERKKRARDEEEEESAGEGDSSSGAEDSAEDGDEKPKKASSSTKKKRGTATQNKDDDAFAPQEDDDASREGDDLDRFINSERDGATSYQRNAVGSRAQRGRGATMVADTPADVWLASASTPFAGLLTVAREWYQRAKDTADNRNEVMSLNEVELLRIVETKLKSVANEQEQLKRLLKQHVSKPVEAMMKNQVKELEKFDVEKYCDELNVAIPRPPEKPEKRRSKVSAVDPQMERFLDVDRPVLRDSAPLEIILESRQQAGSSLDKVGLQGKFKVMKSWLRDREVAVTRHLSDFDLQPVAATGAIGRRFSEFETVHATKAFEKASRSSFVSRQLNRSRVSGVVSQDASLLRGSIGSYFNFHNFREYSEASHIPAAYQSVTTGLDDTVLRTDGPLPLTFDPDATFKVDEANTQISEIVHAFDARQASAMASSLRSVGLPSEQSMWGADSSVSRGGASDDEEAQPPSRSELASKSARVSTGSRTEASSSGSWRERVKQIIIRQVSLYVHGAHGHEKCVPREVFSDVVSELLRRAMTRKSENNRVSMHLKDRDQLELTSREESSIRRSVDHYIERCYSGRGNYRSGRAASVHRQSSVRSHATEPSYE